MAAFNDTLMLAEDIALGRNDQSLGINPQADGPVRKRCRHTVAVPFEGDQACRRDALALLDEAVKHGGERHQCCPLISPNIRDRA
ncbi:hypothetical protein D3C87_1355570 [compost metagenome]